MILWNVVIKMRLIDADKIHRTRAKITEGSKSFYKEWFSASEIDDAPTVKAIPVEWIEKFMNRFRCDMVISDEYALLHYMLTEWEKENEENN